MVKTALVTGGAGFIGSNLVDKLLDWGWQVTVLDNLSRRGSRRNLTGLKKRTIKVFVNDVADFKAVRRAVKDQRVIFHLAGQTAVTTSISRPRADFEANVLGTLNVLEAARLSVPQPALIYASTNKVYGALSGQRRPVNEAAALDFNTPYSASKGAAEQYVRLYYYIYGLPTVVFRQSCIYGPRQLGSADQGWVDHFQKTLDRGKILTLYGTGRQVRDLLHVDDLTEAYLLAVKHINRVKGQVFNLGGGAKNAASLLEVVKKLEKQTGKKAKIKFAPARPGDQGYFVSSNAKARRLLNWRPKIVYG